LVDNQRSLVGLDNLVDLLIRCVRHPRASGETFLVSDGDDLSTPDLIRRLGRLVNRPVRLLPVPPALIRLGGHLVGRSAELERLMGSLQVNMSYTCRTLDWAPPISVDEGLFRTVAL
jgi:nucleoside-diphosphate-sugar epimerase